MSADLAVQKAIRLRLVSTPGVTALVSAEAILDRNARPAPDPSVIIGESQCVDEGRLDRATSRVYATMHIWRKEPGLVGVKGIAEAVRKALTAAKLFPGGTNFHFGDTYVTGVRFMRDPDGETAHGVLTVEVLVSEVA